MNYWILPDTHFGHARMHELCDRLEGFEEKILKNLKVITDDDVLIHLGDICIGNDVCWNETIKRLPGHHWLVLGNHDSKSKSWYLNYWDFVCDFFVLNIFGKNIAFSHRPLPESNLYDINIHGHHHQNLHHPEDNTTKKYLLLYLEHEYKPFNLKKLMR